MRSDENCKFKLHKTETRDWYCAEEVDARITDLEQQLVTKSELNKDLLTTAVNFQHQLAEAKLDIQERHDAHNELFEQHESLKKLWSDFEAEANREGERDASVKYEARIAELERENERIKAELAEVQDELDLHISVQDSYMYMGDE